MTTTFRFQSGFVISRAVAGLFRRPPRTFCYEARCALDRYRDVVVVRGAEHLPVSGPMIVASNHYQRPGMGAEWTAIAVSALIAESVPQADIRWMHTDGRNGYTLFDRLHVPGAVSAVFLKWISDRYGFLRVATDEIGMRAPMLRDAYRLLHQHRGIVGIMPEAGNAPDDGTMGPAKPGAGPALSWLSAGSVPVVPVAVHDADDGTLVVEFGEPFVPPRRAQEGVEPGQLTDALMERVASMLPARLRGHYAEAVR